MPSTTATCLSCLSALLAFVPAQMLHAQKNSSPKQLWSMDLSVDPDFSKRAQADNRLLLRPPSLGFLDNERIVVAFDDNSSALSGFEMRPFGFHVLEATATSGRLGAKRSWQVQNSTSQVVPTRNGRVLVLVGEQLKELSSDFGEIATLSIPLELHGKPTPVHLPSGLFLNPDYERWQIDLTPDGNAVVLAHYVGPRATIEWLGSSDLKRANSVNFTAPGLKTVFAGDDFALVTTHNVPPVLLTRSGEQRKLCDCGTEVARVATNELIFLATRTEYRLVTRTGELRQSGKTKLTGRQFDRAAELDRFAYTSGFYKGSGFPVQTSFTPQMTVHIVDTRTLKQIAEKTFVQPPVPKGGFSYGHESAIALSPDGRHLLVLIGSILSLYAIP